MSNDDTPHRLRGSEPQVLTQNHVDVRLQAVDDVLAKRSTDSPSTRTPYGTPGTVLGCFPEPLVPVPVTPLDSRLDCALSEALRGVQGATNCHRSCDRSDDRENRIRHHRVAVAPAGVLDHLS